MKLSHASPKGKPLITSDLGESFDPTQFPWPIQDNAYDLILCEHVIECLPDTARSLEEVNRISAPGAKVLIETSHFTTFDVRHQFGSHHRFSIGAFDHFLKGNPRHRTDFHIGSSYLFFDDISYLLGIGFFANWFPRQYEKWLAFMFPANSFHITFVVDK